jgi:trk system potassium uptake protein TrkH
VASKTLDHGKVSPDAPLRGGPGEDAGADIVRWLFPTYIFLILAGFFGLRAPGIMPAGNELNPDRAVFTSVNAATLTGFQLSMHPSVFSVTGKVILLFLTCVGSLFTLVVGGMAAKRILRLGWSDGRIVMGACVAQVLVLVLGAVGPHTEGAEGVIGGMVQTSAAWGNSGLYVSVPPGVSDLYTYAVLLPLAVLGGLGLVVLLDVVDALFGRGTLTRHSRVVLQMTAGLFLIGLVGCVLLQMTDLSTFGWRSKDPWLPGLREYFPEIVARATATSVNARTAGMNLFPIAYPRSMSFFIMLLMMVGASPAGTGGGLKTTTVYELCALPVRLLRGERVSRTAGIAVTWFGIYVIAVIVFQILLLWAEPEMPGDRLLFVTISALSNVGLSHDTVTMTRSSLVLVSAAMFFGRITPLLILWWMSDTTRDAELVVG